MPWTTLIILTFLLHLTIVHATPSSLHQLNTQNTTEMLNNYASTFWTWRSLTAPITSDDLPRTAIIRPLHWRPNVSQAALIDQEIAYEHLARDLQALRNGAATNFSLWSVSDQTDYYALTSSLNRIYWEQVRNMLKTLLLFLVFDTG